MCYVALTLKVRDFTYMFKFFFCHRSEAVACFILEKGLKGSDNGLVTDYYSIEVEVKMRGEI
jgi:hypothetical protein